MLSVLLLLLVPSVQPTSMDCGNTKVCGILTLESGLGSGVYHHDGPGVHGLWPEVSPYGDSGCVAPSGSAEGPKKVYSCYQLGTNDTEQLEFEDHEWGKHGVCAGVKDVDDYFNQICSLASGPLSIMAAHWPYTLEDIAAVLRSTYPVYNVDTEFDQLELSACLAAATGQWHLAAPADFEAVCGVAPGPIPAPSPAPSGKCVLNQHGPVCASDGDCEGIPGCLRCAHSGYCTATPLLTEHMNEHMNAHMNAHMDLQVQ